jgi:hypothetical protein
VRAIHIICHREGGRLKNLVAAVGKDIYTSGCWALHDQDDPNELIGGWLYLHSHKNSPSEFGGIVRSYGACRRDDPAAKENGIAFTFEARIEGRGQTWRGADYDRAWTGGIVAANYDHELSSGEKPEI